MTRLKDRLNDAGYGGLWESEHGYIVRLCDARAIFLSADKSAMSLAIPRKCFWKSTNPRMSTKKSTPRISNRWAATTNVTTVHYGTTWDDSTLLEEVKQTNLELERKDGIRRHFRCDWQEVAKYNPSYLAYVEGERERLGENHPLFLTQYCLLPVHGGGGFFSSSQKAQLQGNHTPKPSAGKR